MEKVRDIINQKVKEISQVRGAYFQGIKDCLDIIKLPYNIEEIEVEGTDETLVVRVWDWANKKNKRVRFKQIFNIKESVGLKNIKMKIEIQGNLIHYNTHYGDKVLLVNDEEVIKGSKKEILEKINKIVEAWF